MKKRILSLLMTAIMLLAYATPASANFHTDAELDDDPLSELGTLAEQDGILLEDAGPRASGLPFSMTALAVKNFLTTYNSAGKNFTGSSFDADKGEGLLIEGTLTHSLGKNVKVGAAYYVAGSDTFKPVAFRYFDSGVASTAWIAKKVDKVYIFENSQTYYGYITNYTNTGEVAGTLDFSVSRNSF